MNSRRKEPSDLGNLIRQLRLKKQMYKTSLANLAGLGRTTVNDIELGYIQSLRSEALERVARVLEVPLEHLLNPKAHLDAEGTPAPALPALEFDDEPEKPLTFTINVSVEGQMAHAAVEALKAIAEGVTALVQASKGKGPEGS